MGTYPTIFDATPEERRNWFFRRIAELFGGNDD